MGSIEGNVLFILHGALSVKYTKKDEEKIPEIFLSQQYKRT